MISKRESSSRGVSSWRKRTRDGLRISCRPIKSEEPKNGQSCLSLTHTYKHTCLSSNIVIGLQRDLPPSTRCVHRSDQKPSPPVDSVYWKMMFQMVYTLFHVEIIQLDVYVALPSPLPLPLPLPSPFPPAAAICHAGIAAFPPRANPLPPVFPSHLTDAILSPISDPSYEALPAATFPPSPIASTVPLALLSRASRSKFGGAGFDRLRSTFALALDGEVDVEEDDCGWRF